MISLEGLFFPSQWVAFETCCKEIKKGKAAAWERGGEGWEGGEVGGGGAGLGVMTGAWHPLAGAPALVPLLPLASLLCDAAPGSGACHGDVGTWDVSSPVT